MFAFPIAITCSLYKFIFHLFKQQYCFLKNGQYRPLFVYFRHFHDTISITQIEKSVDGVLGIRTRGRRMVGTDETTELWRPSNSIVLQRIEK